MPVAPAPRRVAGVLACAAIAALGLAACGAGSGGSGEPTWKPKPSFSGEGYQPPDRQPVAPGSSGAPSQGPSSSANQPAKPDSPVVATHLVTPTAVTIMPNNTALVGERTTGRIVRVQPTSGQPVPTVRTLRGLSTVGGGGLLDLALSPNYAQDKLIFAYVTTRKDNRVIAFTLTGPATPVVTGIPRGRTDNAGRIAFTADGSLLVATGDAGHPSLAANPHSLAGKVLRVTDIGRAAAGNPTRGSRVYASGLQVTSGLCATVTSTGGGPTFLTGYRADETRDPIYQLRKAATYGWPTARSTDQAPTAQLPTTSRAPGGCAVQRGVLYTTTLDGKALLAAPIKASSAQAGSLGTMTTTLRNKYGRLRTVVAAADGALWLTTSNRDGNGKPVAADERVLRIVPTGSAGGDNPL